MESGTAAPDGPSSLRRGLVRLGRALSEGKGEREGVREGLSTYKVWEDELADKGRIEKRMMDNGNVEWILGFDEFTKKKEKDQKLPSPFYWTLIFSTERDDHELCTYTIPFSFLSNFLSSIYD